MTNENTVHKMTGVSRSTLVYYDKEGILKPAMRDKFTNYRYYDPQQVITLSFIRQCLFWGIPLSEIKKLLSSRTPADFKLFLSKQHKILVDRLRTITEQLSALSIYENLIDTGLQVNEPMISIQEMSRLSIRLGEENSFRDKTVFFESLYDFMNEIPKSKRYFPLVGYYSDMDAFLSHPSEPTRFALIDPDGESEKPGCKYLVGYARGYYSQQNDLPLRMKKYAERNNLIFKGPVYKIYLHDEMCISDPSQYLYQVSAML
jgi:DNA-binding transcriptional MerR regulator